MRFRILIGAVVALQALAITFVVARQSPLSGDDHSYLYQARLFAAGRLYAEDPLYDYRQPLHSCVELACVRDEGGHRFSKYAPGWSLMLVPGVWAGTPWLVQPLLGALLTFLLLGATRQRHGQGAERSAAVLVTLCLFYAYYAASYRPHLGTALCVFGAFLAHQRGRGSSGGVGARWTALAGVLLGASTLLRYLDWLALGVWIGLDLARHRRRDLLVFLVSFTVLAAGNLLYGWLLTGHPFALPDYLGGDAGAHDRLALTMASVRVTAWRALMLVALFPPALLIAYCWRRARRAGLDLVPLLLFGANALVYGAFTASIGGPGPRYLFSYVPLLVLVVAGLHARLLREGTPTDRRWWRGVILAQVVASAIFIGNEARVMGGRRDLARTIEHAPPTGPRAVLLTTGTFHTATNDLTRNPPDMASAGTLYFANCSPGQIEELRSRFAGREWLAYTYPGRLAPLPIAPTTAAR